MNAFLTGCDKWLAQFYGKLPMDSYNLLERAARTLEGNLSRGTQPWAPLRGIRPSCTVFSGIWNWDSAFHVMALSRWNPELAREQCRIFFRIQQENGLFPDVWFAVMTEKSRSFTMTASLCGNALTAATVIRIR